MPAAQRDGSDRIWTEHGTDISELAEEFAIDPDMLEQALDDAGFQNLRSRFELPVRCAAFRRALGMCPRPCEPENVAEQAI